MIPFDLPPFAMLLWLFLHGAVLGSFLTVCVHRLPRHKSIRAGWWSLTKDASHCDHCQQKLLARDNIPIFGWLLLGGRCRFCKTPIPSKYPLIELANGLLFVVVYALEVPLNHWNPLSSSCLSSPLSPTDFDNVWGLSAVAMVNLRYLFHMVLIEALLVAALIDWNDRQIPRSVTVPALLAGLILSSAFGKFWLVPVWFQDSHVAGWFYKWLPVAWQTDGLLNPIPAWILTHPHWHGLAVSMTGLLVGGFAGWIVRTVGRVAMEREVMGLGDVLLMAMAGSYIGWQPLVIAFYVAPLLALSTMLLVRKFEPSREISYAPYLSAALVLVLLGWRWIWPSFVSYFALGPVLVSVALLTSSLLLPVLVSLRHIQRRFGLAQ